MRTKLKMSLPDDITSDDVMVQCARIDDVMEQGLMTYQAPTDPVFTTHDHESFGQYKNFRQ